MVAGVKMRVCGKAIPTRAAILLTVDFASLVLVTPFVFMVPIRAHVQSGIIPDGLLNLWRLMLAGIVCQAIFYYNELYNLQVVGRSAEMLGHVLRAFGLLFLGLALTCTLLPSLAPILPRVLFFALVLGCLAICTRLLALPYHHQRVLILGSGDEAAEVKETIVACPEWNLEVTQILNPIHIDSVIPPGTDPYSICDRIIVTRVHDHKRSTLARIVNWKMAGLPVEDMQGFLERSTGRIRIEGLTHASYILSSCYTNGAYKRTVKRLFDIISATVILLIASPVMFIVALILFMQRDGDILFRQQRVGLNGRTFQIFKFRTMRPSATENGTRWATDEAHRITKIGAILRKYRLDELPQLINIILGDMSLVGPRPEQPNFCRILADNIPFYNQRHSVPPGLTGWAQVRYRYGSSIEESKRKLEFDLFYVKHLSIGLDCAILIETLKVVLIGRGAI
jgi:exopolysaccharide biosynthesis polyprenyl glycosylphosphotransferase